MSSTQSDAEHCAPAGPGEEHTLLESFAGRWRAEVTMWFGPGEPHVSTGTMVGEMILGGRFLKQVYTGDDRDGPFPGFAGEGYWGYNEARGLWEGVWIDNASNQMQTEAGGYDAANRSWTMDGSMHMGPGVETQKRSVVTVVSDNEHTMEMLWKSPDAAEWQRGMLIRYTRAS